VYSHPGSRPSSDLWVECTEVVSGRRFFYHSQTKKITFEDPVRSVRVRFWYLSLLVRFSLSAHKLQLWEQNPWGPLNFPPAILDWFLKFSANVALGSHAPLRAADRCIWKLIVCLEKLSKWFTLKIDTVIREKNGTGETALTVGCVGCDLLREEIVPMKMYLAQDPALRELCWFDLSRFYVFGGHFEHVQNLKESLQWLPL
jgi:hypothetical protein